MALSGRQITAIAIAACAAVVLAPVSVTAATSGVSIFDPTNTGSGSKARVASGMLAVNDDPSTSFTRYGDLLDDGSSKLAVTIPANKKVTIGSITISNTGGPGGVKIVVQQSRPVSGSSCTGPQTSMGYPFSAIIDAGETTNVTYSPRLALTPRAFATCLAVFPVGSGGSTSTNVSITGTLS